MAEVKDLFPMSEWAHMHAFVQECYRPDHVLCCRKFFEWMFQVKKNDGHATMVCGWDQGRLMSIHGYVPLPVHWGRLDQPVKAQWTMNWMTRQEAPKGLGWVLMRRIQKMGPLQLSVNASTIGAPFLQPLGWVFYSKLPRYVCVFDQAQCVPMLQAQCRPQDLDAYSFDPGILSSDADRSSEMGERGYAPRWELYPELAYATVRSRDYMQWRYLDHPVFEYHVNVLGDPKRPAVCVSRIEQAYGVQNALVGRIVDFFYPADDQGKREGKALLAEVLRGLNAKGCAYADCIMSNAEYGQTLSECGVKAEAQEYQLLPMRLTPVERVVRCQNVIFSATGGLSVPGLDKMYVTKSDLEGDGPANDPTGRNSCSSVASAAADRSGGLK